MGSFIIFIILEKYTKYIEGKHNRLEKYVLDTLASVQRSPCVN